MLVAHLYLQYTITKEYKRPAYKYLNSSITKFHEAVLSQHHLQNTVHRTNPGKKKKNPSEAAAAADKISKMAYKANIKYSNSLR
jgi:hypothetical protein